MSTVNQRVGCSCRIFFRIKASSRMIQAPGNKFNSINNAVSTCMSTTRTSNWSKYKFLKGHQIRTKIQPFHTTFIPTKSIVHTYIHDRKMEVTPPTLVLVYTNHNSHGDGTEDAGEGEQRQTDGRWWRSGEPRPSGKKKHIFLFLDIPFFLSIIIFVSSRL